MRGPGSTGYGYRRHEAGGGLKRVNLTDGDASLMKGRQGTIAGCNLQAVVSPLKVEEGEKAGMLITAVDVVQDPEDHQQLVLMLEQASETTGKQADHTLADAGYYSGANLAACEERKQVVVMPESREFTLQNAYHKDRFSYDTQTDRYICPKSHWLRFVEIRSIEEKTFRVYGGLARVCRQCPVSADCAKKSNRARELLIGPYDRQLRNHRRWMATDAAKELYKHRKVLVEPCFGILKEQMGIRRFLLRGWTQVRFEATAVATAFNLRTLCQVWRRRAAQKHVTAMAVLNSSAATAVGVPCPRVWKNVDRICLKPDILHVAGRDKAEDPISSRAARMAQRAAETGLNYAWCY